MQPWKGNYFYHHTWKAKIMQYPASTVCTLEMYLHPPSKRQAPPASLLPPFTAAQSARMCWSNLSEMATIVLDSDLIPKKPNNRNHFEHLFCAPVVRHCDTPRFPFTSHLSTRLWCTTLLCSTKIQDARNQPHPYFISIMAMVNAPECELWKKTRARPSDYQPDAI